MTKWTQEETGRYWIVGGRYTDPSFKALAWAAPPLGPYKNRADAEASWRGISYAYSHSALTRFVILEEPALAQAA